MKSNKTHAKQPNKEIASQEPKALTPYGQLSNKHKLFIDNLIKNKFNQTKAYRDTYPDCTKRSAEVSACQLLSNPSIERVVKSLIGEGLLVSRIYNLTHSLKDEISLKALDKLMRWKGLYEPETIIAQQFNIDTHNTDEEIVKIIQREEK